MRKPTKKQIEEEIKTIKNSLMANEYLKLRYPEMEFKSEIELRQRLRELEEME